MPEDVPKPQRTSATAVTAASNVHPPPCSATYVDDANSRKLGLKHARTLSIAGPT